VIDYAAVLEDLAEKRAAAVNLFDQVSAGLRLLVPSSPPVEVAPPRQLKAAAKVKKPHRPAAKVNRPAAAPKAEKLPTRIPGTLDLKAIAERDGLRAACTASGVPYATMWARAKAQGWKAAPKHGQHPKAAPKRPAGERTPERICDSCQLHTHQNPCDRCGAKWKRTGP